MDGICHPSPSQTKAELYRLLAECYYPPAPALRQSVEELESSLKEVGSGAAGHAAQMKACLKRNQDLKSLQTDYAKLFVGPFSLLAPPYGSVYLEGERRVMGDSTMDVINRYRQAGLEVSEEFNDAPDHIAAELEFLYYLAFKELQALERRDVEAADGFLKKQHAFLASHLGVWAAAFADQVERNAETEFYRLVARLTRVFIADVVDELVRTSPPKPGQ